MRFKESKKSLCVKMSICAVLILFPAVMQMYFVSGRTTDSGEDYTENDFCYDEYLNEYHENYDSYILGYYDASVIDADKASELSGDSYCNVCNLSGDYSSVLNSARQVITKYGAKNILLALSALENDGEILQSAFMRNEFRDTIRISDYDKYSSQYSHLFRNYYPNIIKETDIDAQIESIAKIKELCEKSDVNLTVVLMPFYCGTMSDSAVNSLNVFREKLAGISDYMDFSNTDICRDIRFFYQPKLPRKDVGTMILSKVFGGHECYPENFGYLVSKSTFKKETKFGKKNPKNSDYTKNVPVLLYHHIDNEGYGDSVISDVLFYKHMSALNDAGYTTVSLKDMIDYVYFGKELPQKPVCITFDDGYLSNYEIAYPILKEFGFKATISVIGTSVGKETYKDTDTVIIPHFGVKESKEMLSSGLIDIQSHTYDMHQSGGLEDTEHPRESVTTLPNESKSEYIEAIIDDYNSFKSEVANKIGNDIICVSYPHGTYTKISEKTYADLGIKVTLSTEYKGKNTLIKGLSQSLRAMYRYTVNESMSAENLIKMIENGSKSS